MKRLLLAIPLGWLLVLSAPPALADDVDEGWEFSFAAYAWALSIDGESGGADVDVPFHDILDDLSFGFMGNLEARRGRWFGMFDALVAQLDADSKFGPTKAEADLDLWMTKMKLVGGYRLLSHALGADTNPRRLTVDAYAGGRLWTFDTDVKLKFPILGTRRISSDTWWIDPVVGVRVVGDVTDRFLLSAVGDLGGFGIGSASKFTWEAQGVLGYRLTDGWTLALGYRAIGLDRNRGSSGFDGTLHGPILGAVYRWGAGRAPLPGAGTAESSP